MNARQNAKIAPRYLELRYEDLVRDTEPVLRRVAEFIELEWDPAMLAYHESAAKRLEELNHQRHNPGRKFVSAEERLRAHALTTAPPQAGRIEVWRSEMSEADRREFEGVAGDLLAELGYETEASAAPAGIVPERLQS
jgi:hypothetical protein